MSLNGCADSLASSSPVFTVKSLPSAAWRLSRNCVLEVPGCALTSTSVKTPVCPSIACCATGSVKNTVCSPAIDSRPPAKRKMPTTLYVVRGSVVMMSIESPSLKPPVLASPALMTTSSAACGPVPSLSWTSWSSPVQLAPKR